MDGGIYLVGVGGLVSVLLSISGYMLHYLVQDIRELKTGQDELKRSVLWLQAEQRSMKEILEKR